MLQIRERGDVEDVPDVDILEPQSWILSGPPGQSLLARGANLYYSSRTGLIISALQAKRLCDGPE